LHKDLRLPAGRPFGPRGGSERTGATRGVVECLTDEIVESATLPAEGALADVEEPLELTAPVGPRWAVLLDMPEGVWKDDRRRTRIARTAPRPRPAHKTAGPKRLKRRAAQRPEAEPSSALVAVDIAADPVTDDALLARLRGGDAAAGEALVGRYCQPHMRYLQRLAGPDVAEELHQQTWLSVLDHLGRFDPAGHGGGAAGGGFKAWLFRIATNKTNDLWRSRGRERNAKEGLRRLLQPCLPHAGVHAEAAEQRHGLFVALEQLPREQREALVLRFYSNMKFAEIAKVMGCPVNTALTRVHKGILKLRQILAPAA
jgi:RNA polymerase sigma-70 factor (ECF subfamily)